MADDDPLPNGYVTHMGTPMSIVTATEMSNAAAGIGKGGKPIQNTPAVPGFSSPTDGNEGPMALYRYCTIGVGAFIFFHFGLQKTALTSFFGFIESAAVICGTIWVNTKRGIAVTQAILYFLVAGLVVLAILATIGYQTGLIKHSPQLTKVMPIKPL